MTFVEATLPFANLLRASRVAVLFLLAILLALPFPAWGLVSRVKVGDPAPDFTLMDQEGRLVKLGEFLGKKNIVLAFYYKAFTPG
jgi:cytochrome oxidase Cu insertion factor (SCO1/SenC/PrrC family)